MSDSLAQFWVHDVVVERAKASGSRVTTHDDPVTERGFVNDGTKLVRGADGKEIVSSAQVAFPSSVARIPVDSKVTLPAGFGGRTSRVVVSAVGDGGGLPTPDHHEIALL